MKHHFLRRVLHLVLIVALLAPTGIIPSITVEAADEIGYRPGILIESDRGMYETLLSLERLNKVGHIMYTGAHPDDESSYFFNYVHDSPRYQVEASYFLSNWGESGNNQIGPELMDGLGIVRSQELYTAMMFDKKTQYYLGSYANGYNEIIEYQMVDPLTGELGAGQWNPDVYLYNAVKTIRLTHPDAIVNHHSISGHAQHQISDVFICLAINAAKDPAYQVRDDDGNFLEPWTVKRMIRSGTSAVDSAVGVGTIYQNRINPFFPKDFISYDSKGVSAAIPWNYPTYNAIGQLGYVNHICQGRSGQAGDGAVNNNTVSNFVAIKSFSDSSYVQDNWSDSSINGGTIIAGIDTSVGRINDVLDAQNQTATDDAVARLKTALDNVVENFPNCPDPVDWNADKPLGAADNDKSYIQAGAATVADVENQIALVADDLRAAAIALKELEDYAAAHKDISGAHAFDYYLGLVREHYNDFTTRLYGVNQNVIMSDYDPSPGQTINITVELECLGSQFFGGNADISTVNENIIFRSENLEFNVLSADDPNEAGVVFPTQMLLNGLPTTVAVPSGSTAKALTAAPVKYMRTGQVFGAEMPVTGYRYEYEIKLAPGYKEYTGPYSSPYNENTQFSSVSPTYPFGTSDYDPTEWTWVHESTAAGYASIAAMRPKNHVDDVVIDITTKVDGPYDKARPIGGNAAIAINGVTQLLQTEVRTRLVPRIAVDPPIESKSVLVKESDIDQTHEIPVRIVNNMDSPAIGVKVTGVMEHGGSGITVLPQTVDVPPKSAIQIIVQATIQGGLVGDYKVLFTAEYDGESFREGYHVIDYTKEKRDLTGVGVMHQVEKQHMYSESYQDILIVDVRLPDDDIKIGFASTGTNDIVFDFIKRFYDDPVKAELNCEIIDAVDLAEGGQALRDRFDTIVVGQEAWAATNSMYLRLRDNESDNAKNLIDFTKLGGNLIFTHQQTNPLGGTGSGGSTKAVPKAGNSLQISGNINNLACPIFVSEDVAMLDVYNKPNAIDLDLHPAPGSEPNVPAGYMLSLSPIWDDWSNQRTEWCFNGTGNSDNNKLNTLHTMGYVDLFVGRDKTSQPLKPGVFGTIVPSGLGDGVAGNWTYCSIVLSRQLTFLTPGVFPIFANLLSLGYKDNNGWGNDLGPFSLDPMEMMELLAEEEFDSELAEELPDDAYEAVEGDPEQGWKEEYENGAEVEETEASVDDRSDGANNRTVAVSNYNSSYAMFDSKLPILSVVSSLAAPVQLVSDANVQSGMLNTLAADDGIDAYLDMLSEGEILVNGVKVQNVTIDRVNKKVIIPANDPALYTASGTTKELTVTFVAWGYNDVIKTGITVRNPKTSSGATGGTSGSSVAPISTTGTTGTPTPTPSASPSPSPTDGASTTISQPVSVEADGFSFTAPAGAANSGSEISGSATEDYSPAPVGSTLASDVFSLNTSGGEKTLNKPGEMTIAYYTESVVDADDLAVYYYDEAKGEWVFLGGVVNDDGAITVPAGRFTQYAVFENPGMRKMSDIGKDHWAHEYIRRLIGLGIVDGYPDEDDTYYFDPESDITRAEMIKLIVVSLDIEPIDDFDGSVFVDWDDVEDWAKPYIAAAYAANIVKGSLESDGLYANANESITRQEMIVMTTRALNANIPSGGASTARDFDQTADWAKDAMAFAIENGMINTNNGVAPEVNATRAEAAMALYKMLEYLMV
ncbi:MAG: S-layer homology domain-containing protein [Oscillospiraceae bacterium]|nr:S-layer homology domain-containing protein [Oscillospiraceae bacterium]